MLLGIPYQQLNHTVLATLLNYLIAYLLTVLMRTTVGVKTMLT